MTSNALNAEGAATDRWWPIPIGCALAAMVLTAVVLFLPLGKWTVVLTAGLVVGPLVLLWNYARDFGRRCLGMAATALGAVVVVNAPKMGVVGSWGEATFGAWVEGRDWAVDLGLCFVAVAFGIIGLLYKRPQLVPARSANVPAPQTTGDNSPAAGGDQEISYSDQTAGGSITNTNVNQEMIDKMISLAQEKGGLGEKLQHSQATIQENESLIRDLQATVDRLQAAADANDPEAKLALEEARRTGDMERVQAALIAIASQHDQTIRGAAAEFVTLCREIATVAYLRGDINETTMRLRSILRSLPNDLDALNRLGHVEYLRGDFPEAERRYRQILDLASDDAHRAVPYGNLGIVLLTRGDPNGAEAMHRKSLEIEEKLGGLEGMANQYGNLGNVLKTRGDLDGAETMYRKSLEINGKLGRLEEMANQYGSLGNVLQNRGDLDEAEAMYRKSLEIDEKLGHLRGMALSYGNLGIVLGIRGDLDGAETIHRKALAIDKRLGHLEGIARQYGNLGIVLQARGDVDDAEIMFRKSLKINEKLDRLEGMANQYGNLALIFANRGNVAKARTLWTKARDLFDQIGMPHMVEKVQCLLDSLPDTVE